MFFSISPVIILYTMGYRYDITHGFVREVGSLSIDVEPKDVTIMLGDAVLGDRSPLRLTNLTPGTYRLSLTSDSFHTWEKDITIESKQTYYVKDVELVENKSPKNIELPFEDKDILGASFSYDGKYALLRAHNSGLYETILYNIEDNSTEILTRQKIKTSSVFGWSPYASHGFITTKDESGQTTLLLFSAENTDEQVTTLLNTNDYRQWDAYSSAPSLFVQDGENIKHIRPEKISAVGTTQHHTWYVDQEKTLWTFDTDKKRLSRYVENTPIIFDVDEPISKIVRIENGHTLLRSPEKTYIWYIDEENHQVYKNHTLDTQSLHYNHLTDSWLSWSPWELWEVSQTGSASLLTRSGARTNSVYPLDEFGRLLLRTDDSLNIFDPRYETAQHVTSQAHINDVVVDTGERLILFFTDDQEQQEFWNISF